MFLNLIHEGLGRQLNPSFNRTSNFWRDWKVKQVASAVIIAIDVIACYCYWYHVTKSANTLRKYICPELSYGPQVTLMSIIASPFWLSTLSWRKIRSIILWISADIRKYDLQWSVWHGNIAFEFSLNVFIGFSEFSDKNKIILKKGLLEPAISCVRNQDSTSVPGSDR